MNWFANVIFAILEVALRSLRNAYSFVGNSRQIGPKLVGLGKMAKPRARPCLAVALSVVLALCLTSLMTTVSAAPADPGHAASRISAGTFEAGNFVFPDNLTINDFLTVNFTTLYVDAIQGYVGIGTSSPSTKLDVNGSLNINGNITMPYSFFIGSGAAATGSDSVSIGRNAQATNTSTVALGYNSDATGQYATALGYTAQATADYAIAEGYYANATADSSMAIGRNAQAINTSSVALGYNTDAAGYRSTAVGVGAQTTNQYATALGYNANATNNSATSIGSSSDATGEYATAIGNAAEATGSYATAVGRNTKATGSQATALGYLANASAGYAIAMGPNAMANNSYAIAIGDTSRAKNYSSIALAANADATGYAAVAIGESAEAENSAAVALGYLTDAKNSNAVAIGYLANATGNWGATAIGSQTDATGNWATAIGVGAQATGSDSLAIGEGANATNSYTISMGYYTDAKGIQAIAIGGQAQATGTDTIAAGTNANATATNAIAIGEDSDATHTSSVALGREAATTAAKQFMVGSSGYNLDTYIYGNLTTTENMSAPGICLNGDCRTTWPAEGGGAGWSTSGLYVYNDTAGVMVGIGTASPSGKLHVNTTGETNALVVNDTSGNVGIGTASPNYLLEVADGTEDAVNLSGVLYVNDTSGNVGIGTTSPSELLHVSGEGNPKIIVVDTTNNATGRIFAGNTDIYLGSSSNHPVRLQTNADTKMYIGTDGKVGIGTTSPAEKLHIIPPNGDPGLLIGNNSDTSSYTSGIIVQGPNDGGKGILIYPRTSANPTIPEDPTTGVALKYEGNDDVAYLVSSDDLAFTTGIGATLNEDPSGTEAMRIDSNGNVGIGDATPSAKLDINSTNETTYTGSWSGGSSHYLPEEYDALYLHNDDPTGDFSSLLMRAGDTSVGTGRISLVKTDSNDGAFTFSLRSGSSMTEKMKITDKGEVGIGTSNPSGLLHLDSTSNTTQIIEAAPNNDSTLKLLEQGTGDVGAYLKYDGANNRFGIWVGNDPPTEKLTVLRDYNYVGINDTTPSYALDVKGTIRATDDILIDTTSVCQSDGTNCPSGMANSSAWNRSGTNVFLANTGDSVGIGTDSPNNELDVNGSLELSGGLGTGIFGTSTDYTYYQIAQGDYHHRFYTRTDVGTASERFTIEGGAVTGNVYFQNSKVGIGTASPSGKLQVNGSIFFHDANGDDSARWGIYGWDNQFQFTERNADWSHNATPFLIESGAETNTLVVDTDSRVGIGTTGPDGELEIVNAGNVDVIIDSEGGSNDNSSLWFYENEVERGRIYWEGDGNDFRWDSALGDIILQPSGNVGIGTTSPSMNLEVYDTSANILINGSSAFMNINKGAAGTKAEVRYLTAGSNTWYAGVSDSGDAGSGNEYFIGESAGGANAAFWIEPTSGNVGIGTSSPLSLLHINQTGDTLSHGFTIGRTGANRASLFLNASDDTFHIDRGTTNGIIIDNSGDVGIGTDSPGENLDIKASSSNENLLRLSHPTSPTAAGFTLGFGNIDSTDDKAIVGKVEYSDAFYDVYTINRGTRDFIINDGNVGIGDTSPDAPLEINSTTTPQFMISHTDGVDYANFTVDSDGNLTISSSSGNVFIQLG